MGRTYVLVPMYLVAIVLANLSVARFGPSSSIVNAFLFIGLDLTSRDRLHDLWAGKRLWLKMGCLVVVGSALSWALDRDAGLIALASMAAFLSAGVVDTLAYNMLGNRAWWVRVNGSNVFAAGVDSIVFPSIAFGAFMPVVILGQFAAKTMGGLVWSLILRR